MKTWHALRGGVVAGLLALLLGCSGAEERKASFMKKGEELLAARNYEKARLEFRNALQIDPKDTLAQTLAARAAERAGEFREAAQFYNSAMKDPERVDARVGLARLILLSGDLNETSRLVEEGLAQSPDHPGLLALRGAVRIRRGDEDGARADAERAVALAPENEDAAALLASLHSRAGRFDDAIGVIGRTLEARPDSLDLRVIMAQLQLDAGRRELAEAELRRIVELDPANVAHRYRLAQFHVIGNRIDDAEKALREAIALRPDDVEPKLALAQLIASRRSFEQGELSLKALIDDDRDDLALQLGLGRFYQAHDRPVQAAEVFQAVIEAGRDNPRALEARNLLAGQLLRAGDVDGARGQIEAVLKESPRDNEALVMRANLAMGRGDAPGAVADLRAVLRDQPNAQPLLRALARAYQAGGDATLAEETLRSAVQANPRDIPSRLALAQFLIQADRPDEAQPVVDQLVADQPGDLPSLEAAFRVQVARRDLAGARRSATTIQSLRPELPTGAYLLGLVDEAEGRLDQAAVHLEKALELSKNADEPLAALVRVDVAAKRPERALARLDADPRAASSPLVHTLRAEVLLSMRRFAPAREAIEGAIALAPTTWRPYRTLATIGLAEGDATAAQSAYQRGIRAVPGSSPLHTDLAQLQERTGNPDAAVATYEAWLAREPRSEVAANNLAMLLITHKATDKAALDRALTLALPFQLSANAAYLDTLGWVRYVRGEFIEAVPALQRAVDLAPRVPALRARLGLAQFKAGQRSAAKSNLETALRGELPAVVATPAKEALAQLQAG